VHWQICPFDELGFDELVHSTSWIRQAGIRQVQIGRLLVFPLIFRCRSKSKTSFLSLFKVNNMSLTSVSHDEAIHILHNSGDELILAVKHYKSAAPFLLKNCRQLIPETDGM